MKRLRIKRLEKRVNLYSLMLWSESTYKNLELY
jgi:hypothetical protein